MIGLIVLVNLQSKVRVIIQCVGQEEATSVVDREEGPDEAPGTLGLKIGVGPGVVPCEADVFVRLVGWSYGSKIMEVFEVVG